MVVVQQNDVNVNVDATPPAPSLMPSVECDALRCMGSLQRCKVPGEDLWIVMLEKWPSDIWREGWVLRIDEVSTGVVD